MEDQEQTAIRFLREGNICGLESLFGLYQLRAVRMAFLIAGDRELAEDAVMDAFLTVYERVNQFDMRRPFFPWFYRMVVNNTLMALRKTDAREVRGERYEHLLRQLVSRVPGPDEEAVARDLQRSVIDALHTLLAKQRAALVRACVGFFIRSSQAVAAGGG